MEACFSLVLPEQRGDPGLNNVATTGPLEAMNAKSLGSSQRQEQYTQAALDLQGSQMSGPLVGAAVRAGAGESPNVSVGEDLEVTGLSPGGHVPPRAPSKGKVLTPFPEPQLYTFSSL